MNGVRAVPRFAINATGARTTAKALAINRILVPTDFSAAARRAFKCATDLAKAFRAELIVLNVIDTLAGSVLLPADVRHRAPGSELVTAEAKLRCLTKSALAAGVVTVGSAVRAGIAAQEIASAAQEFDVDVIVMATHGYTGWRHLCIGSTAEQVARIAPCSVLIAREKDYAF